jgi:hypothetical protein
MDHIEYTLSDLLNFSSQNKPIDFEIAFNSIIKNKIEYAVDNRKIELGQSMFASAD